MVGLASRRTAVATWKMKLSPHLRVFLITGILVERGFRSGQRTRNTTWV